LDGNIPVPDSYFTASSKWDASYAAPRARLDGGGGFWSPNGTEMTANPLTCFLQVSQVFPKQTISKFRSDVGQHFNDELPQKLWDELTGFWVGRPIVHTTIQLIDYNCLK